MIIVRLAGGIGNQMFQYALGRRLSLERKTELLLDASWYKESADRSYALNHFRISEELVSYDDIRKTIDSPFVKITDLFTAYRRKKYIKERSFLFDAAVLSVGTHAYLDGYWQSPKYFEEIADTLRKDFTLKEPLREEYQAVQQKISATNSVSLHIRRGDYLLAKHQNIYIPLPLEYYQQAADFISNQAGACTFFVFSDDIEWAKENLSLPYPIEYVSGKDIADYEELMLMAACAHNITANSSFSWWGAWLNRNPEKIIVTPKRWFVDGRSEADLIPPSWIRL